MSLYVVFKEIPTKYTFKRLKLKEGVVENMLTWMDKVRIRAIGQIQQGTFASLWLSHATKALCSPRNRNEPRLYAS